MIERLHKLKMDKYLGILLLLVGSCGPILGSDNNEGDNFKDILPNVKDGSRSRNVGDILLNRNFDYNFNNNKDVYRRDDDRFFDAGNPDIHGVIERPCQAYDTFCIRKFFAEHSRCKISGRRVPDPLYRAQMTFDFPSANISAAIPQLEYKGLDNARVEEFYINKKTDNLVIAFNFDEVSLSSRNVNLKFYLRGREPEVHRDFGSLIYSKITVTLVIPGLDDLRLDRAEIYTYSTNPLPPFVVGPNLALSSDPEVLAMFTFFATVNVPVENLEGLSTEGVFYGTNYLQYNICDFGLKVL